MILHFAEMPPLFDFRIEGVSSLSVDLHKFGYAAKGHRQLNELGARKPLNGGHVDFP
jgi:hypothetical protein